VYYHTKFGFGADWERSGDVYGHVAVFFSPFCSGYAMLTVSSYLFAWPNFVQFLSKAYVYFGLHMLDYIINKLSFRFHLLHMTKH